jgi:hypothetical protein
VHEAAAIAASPRSPSRLAAVAARKSMLVFSTSCAIVVTRLPGACAIGAEIARATFGGAAEERADERGDYRGGRDADARGGESGRRDVSKPCRVLLGEGAMSMPVFSMSCAIVVPRLRALVRSALRWRARSAQDSRATVGGAAERRADERGEDRGGRPLTRLAAVKLLPARRLEPLACRASASTRNCLKRPLQAYLAT